MRTSFAVVYIFFLIPFLSPSYAQTVALSINSKLTAEAEFHAGDSNKPAILIIHGFLTTNQFHTVQSIKSELNSNGYTTLTPNLTLNINNRAQSLKCQSIHTHTLQGDINEIVAWTNWLKQKGYKRIVTLGHSSGSQEILAAQQTPDFPQIDLTILTSLFYINGQELGTKPEDIRKARQLIEKNQKTIDTYSFLYCKNNYNATAESFLSYQTITRHYILEALKHRKNPTHIIMGGQDQRYKLVGKDWLNQLKETKATVHMIDTANHFFAADAEFDLQETIIKILEQYE